MNINVKTESLSDASGSTAIDFFSKSFQIAKLSRQLKAAERFLVPQYEEAALSCLLNPSGIRDNQGTG
jgi:hypothetical protein